MILGKVCLVNAYVYVSIVSCVLIKVEESKVVRVQLELAQVKADIDRRIHEKEEEFEITRLHPTYCICSEREKKEMLSY